MEAQRQQVQEEANTAANIAFITGSISDADCEVFRLITSKAK